MTCPNQLELGEKKLRESSEADAPVREGPSEDLENQWPRLFKEISSHFRRL